MTAREVMCPVCWHEQTFRGIENGYEAAHDEVSKLRWHPPYGGARAQVCTVWDAGGWVCEVCGVRLTPEMAFLMIDAVLRVSDPDSDSYDAKNKCFADASAALRRENHENKHRG